MHRVPSASQLSDSGDEIELKSLRRSSSGLHLVDLDDAERLNGTWSFDRSKLRGHQFDSSLSHAVLTCFDPSSNEYWNCLTEILPIVHLLAMALELAGVIHLGHDVSGGSAALRHAVIGTYLGSVAQHACSLVAHAGRSISPRLSHAVWYIDFAGIFVNNVWNAAPLLFVLQPALAQTAWLGPAMLAYAILCSAVLLWLGVRQAVLYTPRGRDDRGDSVTILNFINAAAGGRTRGLLCVLLLVLPNAILSVLTGVYVDRRAPLPLVGFVLSFGIKVTNVPNRWARAGAFDFSPLHSHTLWHLGVWAAQSFYVRVYLTALALPAPPPAHGAVLVEHLSSFASALWYR